MSKILYHYAPAEVRDSILKEGLSGEYDQTSPDDEGGGVVYLIDRLGGNEINRDLWRQERPGGQIPQGVSDDELMSYFEAKRETDRIWAGSVRRALSRGDITHEEAEKKNFWNPDGGNWEALPAKLYHVTTNVDGVMQGGLRTRREIGVYQGTGLGGGSSDAISFTEDLATAEGIASSLREMHDVASGKTTVAEMFEAAKTGKDAKRPFLAEMMHYWDRDWKTGDKLPDGVKALLAGKKIEMGKLGDAPDAEHEWQVHAEGKHSQVWVGESGKTYSSYYIREASEEERREDRVEFFKRFGAFREWAGGPLDPLFFSSDPVALAKLDKEQIQVLQVRPAPGANGYKMNALGEWRTGSGEAIVVQGIVKAGKLAAISAIDIWAVEAEGLELEEDVLWSGEGQSWMLAGSIGPGRVQLLSGVDEVSVAAKRCMGHEEQEISKVVREVGDKWEAAFRLWRELEPDSDVPRCRTLIGQGVTGDGWPPMEVRSLVGLDDNGEALSKTTWVRAPYEMLGAGEDRFAVALCEAHVLKIDPYWRNATDHEVEVWEKASEKLRTYLCPVLSSGEVGYYGWLMMPRCQAIEVDEKTRESVQEVLGLGDVHDYNLGRLHGKVVILDYGTQDESGPVVLSSEARADDERVLSGSVE